MKKTLLLSAALLGLLFASCRKSTSNPPSQPTGTTMPTVNYQLKATNTSYAMANKTTVGSGIVWTTATAIPDVVKFEAIENNVSVTFTSTNDTPINLLSSVALTFGGFTLPPGTYNEIELKIDLDKMGTTPILQLNGLFTFDSFSAPISISVTNPVELQTEQNNVVITTDSSYTAVTTLDLSSITARLTPTMLMGATMTGGTIVISADSNRDLYDIVLVNLEHERHHFEFERHEHGHH